MKSLEKGEHPTTSLACLRVSEPLYLTIAQAARLVGASERTVYRWAETEPTMPVLRVGGIVRIHRVRFLRWLEEHEQGRRRRRSTGTPSVGTPRSWFEHVGQASGWRGLICHQRALSNVAVGYAAPLASCATLAPSRALTLALMEGGLPSFEVSKLGGVIASKVQQDDDLNDEGHGSDQGERFESGHALTSGWNGEGRACTSTRPRELSGSLSHRCTTSAEDLIGHLEDAPSGSLGDALAPQPVLDVATAELGAVQAERLGAEQRHTLSLYLTQTSRQRGAVAHCLIGMAEQNVSKLVKGCLEGHGVYRVVRHGPTTSETERVAFWQIEGSLGYLQRGQGSLSVPLRDDWRWHLAPLGLRVHKPMRLERKPSERLGILGAVVTRDRAAHREWHPQPQRPLAALDVATLALPRLIGRER